MNFTGLEQWLLGALIGLIGFIVGEKVGGWNKISEKNCIEKRDGCQALEKEKSKTTAGTLAMIEKTIAVGFQQIERTLQEDREDRKEIFRRLNACEIRLAGGEDHERS